jgi:glycosyltransferase involved in cell wall biosynthesis/Ser/Thr protein kinase RdoA (MazF antagonist)
VTEVVDAEAAVNEAPAAEAPRVQPPRIRSAIGVIVTRFPQIDETSILREINELEERGQPVMLIPLLRGRGGVVHDEARPWIHRARYMPLISPAIVLANLIYLATQPRRYLALFWRVFSRTIGRAGVFARSMALFPKSVYLARLLPRLGIRHVHAQWATHPATMAYIIASLSDVTYSFTVHGPDVFAHRLLVREKIAGAKFIRAVSTFNKAFVCGLFSSVTENKVEVVHVGLNPVVYQTLHAEPCHPEPAQRGEGPESHVGDGSFAALRRSAAPPAQDDRGERSLRVLTVAALNKTKGFPFLIEAISRLAAEGIDVECEIVGTGPRRAAIEHWMKQFNVADRVHLLGLLPQHEIAARLRACDVFVLPSMIALDGTMDGLPVALIEAMAAGRPVIASTISGIPELVHDGVSGFLVDSTHPERIAQAMRRLADDPALRERMGRAGQEKVRHEFDIHVTGERLMALFDRAAAPKRSVHQQIASLDWSELGAVALGVRRVYERRDSFVADVTITDGVARRDVIVKKHLERSGEPRLARIRAQHERDMLLRMRSEMMFSVTNRGTIYSVPRMLLFDEPRSTFVLARAKGQSLASMLRRVRGVEGSIRRIAPAIRRAGMWLQFMQDQTRSSGDGRAALTAFLREAERDLALASAVDWAVRQFHDLIAARLQKLESAMKDPLFLVAHHGDYAPSNIFIAEGAVDVVGFDDSRDGLPLEDVAHFVLHLRFASRHPGELAKSFFEGCGGVDEEQLKVFILARALQLLARGSATKAELARTRRQRNALRKAILETLT